MWDTRLEFYPREGKKQFKDKVLNSELTPLEYKNIMASVKPYVDEKFQSWIHGVSDFETDYNGFIKEL